MPPTNENAERSPADDELISALEAAMEAKLNQLLAEGGPRPYMLSEFDIRDTHMKRPLEDVAQWGVFSGFTYHDFPVIEHLVPEWLSKTLQHRPYPVITLWIRKDWQIAISYLKEEEARIFVLGYEVLDDATMKPEGIKILTQLLRAPSDKEES